jgi:hypothetical protein
LSDNQAEFKGWARVEVMGHQSHVGYVTTEAYGQAVLFRIDRPEIPEAEETLAGPEWVGEQRCPAGTIVKRPKLEAATVLVGSGSIYRMIPCTEAVAMKAIRESERRPLILVKLPEVAQLPAAPVQPLESSEDVDLRSPDDSEEDYDEDGSGRTRERRSARW